MLGRGGWRSAAVSAFSDGQASASLLSKHLARECALLRSSECGTRDPNAPQNALVLTSRTDFGDLAGDGHILTNESCGLGFSTSNCGRFMLIFEGCTIIVYALDGSCLRPVTRLICPRRVRTVNMNTSAGRYALAALLEGRTGMVCDLENDLLISEIPSPQVYSDRSDLGVSVRTSAEACPSPLTLFCRLRLSPLIVSQVMLPSTTTMVL